MAGEEGEEGTAAEAPTVATAAAAVRLSDDKVQEFAQYDLTAKLAPYLDRHLMFPILHFLLEIGMYKEEDVIRAEMRLLEETCMVDFLVDKYKDIGEEAPASLNERREEVVKKISETSTQCWKLLNILEDDTQVAKITKFERVSDLCADFGIEEEDLDRLVHYAKLVFDCGNYALCSMLLEHYRSMQAVMIKETERPVNAKSLNCIWGLLAALILYRKPETEGASKKESAADLIFKLDEILAGDKLSKKEVLVERCWLLHWMLFEIFTPQKLEFKLVETFVNQNSLSIISLSCPHLFRYVGACLILHKRLKALVKDTVWIIHHESGSYSDPITRFLLALYIDMDFDEAQQELQKCAMVCKGDFFLRNHWNEFEENARLLIFETYCRIHQCINIKMIASKLNMEAEEAELWIVKLIQSAKLDARIDSEKSRVVMSKAPPSVYQQVIEKTKNLAFRSTMLLSNLEKKERERGGQLMP